MVEFLVFRERRKGKEVIGLVDREDADERGAAGRVWDYEVDYDDYVAEFPNVSDRQPHAIVNIDKGQLSAMKAKKPKK